MFAEESSEQSAVFLLVGSFKNSGIYSALFGCDFEQCLVVNVDIQAFSQFFGNLFSATRMDDSKVVRSAYTGALCACSVKRNIEVEYCSFSRSHEIRFLVTDLIKYTENRVRAALGIRSRLTVYALPNNIRAMADLALESILPAVGAGQFKKKEAPAAYEKLYDLPRQPLSIAAAEEIDSAMEARSTAPAVR